MSLWKSVFFVLKNSVADVDTDLKFIFTVVIYDVLISFAFSGLLYFHSLMLISHQFLIPEKKSIETVIPEKYFLTLSFDAYCNVKLRLLNFCKTLKTVAL